MKMTNFHAEMNRIKATKMMSCETVAQIASLNARFEDCMSRVNILITEKEAKNWLISF
jgi:hypothetical protein